MRHLGIAVVAVALAGCNAGEQIPAAKVETEKFRQLYQEGNFPAIYRAAGKELTGTTSAADWTQLMGQIKGRLGDFRSAPEPGWNVAWNNGVQSITLGYNSTFERGLADETFIYRIVGGKPVLAGYNIKSADMLGD